MSSSLQASVVVRTRDSAVTLGAAMEALAAQSVRPEIVVVDSGSTDGTLDLARRHADRIVTMSPHEFSYGRALNAGVAAASGDILFALSSHVVPPDRQWVAGSMAYYADPAVVATCGDTLDHRGRPLGAPVRQDGAMAGRWPLWGLANTAASWRGDLVRSYPFDEELEASEDKEWALRVLAATGGVVVVDPRLAVDQSHRTGHGLVSYFDRVRRERRALLRVGALERRSLPAVARAWWTERRDPQPGRRGLTSVTGALDSLAEMAALRDVRRHGGPVRREVR